MSERCVALFCGSRDWADRLPILEAMLELPKHAVVIHGGQRGADTIAGRVAHDLGLHVAGLPWRPDLYGKGAGPKRNDALMALMPTVGYAYPLPQSRGTWDMVRKLKLANVPVFVANEVLIA
jgi:YspA, cpYpsA-related SLOG family